MYYTYELIVRAILLKPPTTGLKWKQVLKIVTVLVAIASIFEVTGILLWITMGVIVANPPNGSKWISC